MLETIIAVSLFFLLAILIVLFAIWYCFAKNNSHKIFVIALDAILLLACVLAIILCIFSRQLYHKQTDVPAENDTDFFVMPADEIEVEFDGIELNDVEVDDVNEEAPKTEEGMENGEDDKKEDKEEKVDKKADENDGNDDAKEEKGEGSEESKTDENMFIDFISDDSEDE